MSTEPAEADPGRCPTTQRPRSRNATSWRPRCRPPRRRSTDGASRSSARCTTTHSNPAGTSRSEAGWGRFTRSSRARSTTAELAAPVGDEHSRRRARESRSCGATASSWTRARPFHEVAVAPAEAAAVATWLERMRPQRAQLDVGELRLEPGVRFALDAGGFDRHTFFCGQSGSGKTYALGTVLEQLLLETTLRHRRARSELRLRASRGGARRSRRGRRVALPQAATDGSSCGERRAAGSERLHVRFTDCDAEEQAAVLRLDPIRDRDEYGALVELLESGFEESDTSARDWRSDCSGVRARASRRSVPVFATSGSTGGRSGRRETTSRCRTWWRREGLARSSSTSARSGRRARRRSRRRACSPSSGGAARSASRF